MSSSLSIEPKQAEVSVELVKVAEVRPLGERAGEIGHRIWFKPCTEASEGQGDVLTLDRVAMQFVINGLEPLKAGEEVVLHRRSGEILAITTCTRRAALLYCADPSVLKSDDIFVQDVRGLGQHGRDYNDWLEVLE
ncbi:hypothetical protein COV82_01900 [Candidatus Peregrinibacteria bacterium CG11_big_fil_rev_8_21_14_0_20_46_8]|nr:MAG: hypothetical protein COV82_01900 [Candidatus Peregrinibacteria bacterium CG11_big_fil_rev_8_21_14_0_20_46_8]